MQWRIEDAITKLQLEAPTMARVDLKSPEFRVGPFTWYGQLLQLVMILFHLVSWHQSCEMSQRSDSWCMLRISVL